MFNFQLFFLFIVDFGVSSLDAKKAKTFVGTPFWMSPELIDSKNGLSKYDKKVDIWALGITAIELAETVPPLSYINPMRALFQIPARDSPQLEKREKWTATFHDFIAKCLEKNPKKRPDADELLQHPFVRDCNKDPQILIKMNERRAKLEAACEYSDEEEEDEEERSTMDSEYVPAQPLMPINPFAQPKSPRSPRENQPPIKVPTALPPKPEIPAHLQPNNQPAPRTEHRRSNSQVQNLRASTSHIPNGSSPPKPRPISQSPINNHVARSTSTPPTPVKDDISSSPAVASAVSPTAAARPTSTRSTLKRPPNTRRATKKGNDGKRPVNRKVIKQQMNQLRALQARLQKRIDKQEKGHQREKDQITDQYKRQLDQLAKNQDMQKKNLEKMHKQEQEGLNKSQLRDQRALQKNYENENRLLLKKHKDTTKVSAKEQLTKKKELEKEQKLQRTQSKKMLSKAEYKALEKEHKIQIQLNDILHRQNLEREARFKELKVEWDRKHALDDLGTEEMKQTHQQEREMLKQTLALEFQELEQMYNLRVEEQQKLQPLERRLMEERHELEQQNFNQQLAVEKEQQMSLLQADQRQQTKDHNIKLKKLVKECNDEQRQLKNSGRSKNEIKMLIQQSKDMLSARQQEQVNRHEKLLAEQLQEEEAQLVAHQERQKQQLREKQAKKLEQLEKFHINQRSELHHEEMQARRAMLDDHNVRELELFTKHNEEQTKLLDEQHQEKFMLRTQQNKAAMDKIASQRQECIAFIDANIDKLPISAEPKFKDQINNLFDEVVEVEQKTNETAKGELSKLMEVEQEKLKAAQQEFKKELLIKQDKAVRELDTLDKAYASVLSVQGAL